ncbi:Uncharacterised protein [Staphylococcus aureus]|nr:Uncharacterised protein [Staphylococcus aureus]CAC6672577.1 Uncharacterised protein [Staphylococcus aureus]CAC7083777.1 Uncharacterised protein [Staphylococcus aureus]CPO00784.1 Uncharacterised protein [Staphylococcus aureus]
MLFFAYSSKYIAVPIPRMIDNGMILNINQSEPINAPLTPAIDGVEEEKLVKNCKFK